MNPRLVVTLLVAASLALLACDPVKPDWNVATQTDSRAGYSAFILKNPGSEFESEAMRRIDELDWARATEIHSVDAYLSYVDEHPDGIFADTAAVAVEEASWDEALQVNQIDSYIDYLDAYADGMFAEEAALQIGSMLAGRLNRDLLPHINGRGSAISSFSSSQMEVSIASGSIYVDRQGRTIPMAGSSLRVKLDAGAVVISATADGGGGYSEITHLDIREGACVLMSTGDRMTFRNGSWTWVERPLYYELNR